MKHDQFVNSVLAPEEMRQIGSQPVLVALSGGADSVALLRVLLEVGCVCRAAHCNFHLRGDESMRDEQFVRDLCQRLDVPLTVKDFDVQAWQQQHGGSVEMACRELRYEWFEQERVKWNCHVIAVAHHADDQIETFFLNLLRGTGIKGLTGMERLNGNIWRPLLGVSRADILEYLAALGQDYVSDSTNAMNEYRRNHLRNIVLPAITQQFSQARQRIIDTMDNLRRDQEVLNNLIAQMLPDEHSIAFDVLNSQSHAPTLLYHRTRSHGFNYEQCEQAVEAARAGHSGKQFPGRDAVLVVNRDHYSLEPIQSPEDISIPLDLTAGITSPVHITVSRNNPPFSPLMCDGKKKVAFNTHVLDCQHIVLRHWRRGDRFKPYGMNGSKLVSDLFADLKLDHAAKQSTWLLEADGEILWVLGLRSSALYPVTREAHDYLFLSLPE